MTKQIPQPLSTGVDYDVDPGRAYVLFAGVMMALIAALNVVAGIAAIDNSKVYVRNVEFILSDLQTWGWVMLVVGVLQGLTAVGIFLHSQLARWAGIAFASANIIVEFMVVAAHPAWTLMVFFIDVTVIFALVTYGGRDRYSLR